MSSLKWDWTGATCWHAQSVTGDVWRIKVDEAGMFHLVDNNRLPYNAAAFHRLRSAKSWCEEREVELIAAQPKRRLAKLYRSTLTGTLEIWDTDDTGLVDGWECIGSAWITKGEFADD